MQISLLESADATCQLLQTCTNETEQVVWRLCHHIDEIGLGRRHVLDQALRSTGEYFPPLLPPQIVVKVLTCMQNSPCKKKPNRWVYNETEPGIMHLRYHGAKVPINSLVAQLERMDKEEGLAWFSSQKVESTSADSVSFDKELAKTAWEVGHLETLPKLLVVLGEWKKHMPQLLMEELVTSRRMELAKLKDMAGMKLKALRSTFQSMRSLVAKLVDAEQLSLTLVATELAENLVDLTLDCLRCSHVAKSPTRKDWDQFFGQDFHLQSLKMMHFHIETLLLDKVFHKLPNLTTLNLDYNEVRELPEKIFQTLPNLKTLNLNGNELTQLPETIFQGLPNLKTLKLGGNRLTKLPDQIFQDLPNLTTLNLGYNLELAQLPEKIFQGLSNLKILNLGHTPVRELPEKIFQGLPNLKILDLEATQLTKLPEKIFQDLPNLATLNLQYNQLKLPEKIFQGLPNLKTLTLASGFVNKLLPEKIFQGLPNLKTLNLGHTPPLRELPEKIFQGLPKLKTLNLVENQLTKLPEKIFQGLSNVTILGLDRQIY